MKHLTRSLLIALAMVAAPLALRHDPAATSPLAAVRIEVSEACAAVPGDTLVGCEPAPGYICSTPRADYFDKKPIVASSTSTTTKLESGDDSFSAN